MVLCICLVLHVEAEGLKEIDRLNENIQEATKEKGMGNTFYTIHKHFMLLTSFQVAIVLPLASTAEWT